MRPCLYTTAQGLPLDSTASLEISKLGLDLDLVPLLSPSLTIAHYLKHLELYELYNFFKDFSSLLLFFNRASI